MALSKTTIYWMVSSLINPPNKAISYGFVLQPREIGIALQYGLSKAELRSTLLNEIHHVTVYEINLNKLNDQAKTKTILEYPFLNEQGEIDNSLRAELSFAIDQLNSHVKDFISLEAKNTETQSCKKDFLGILRLSMIIRLRFIE